MTSPLAPTLLTIMVACGPHKESVPDDTGVAGQGDSAGVDTGSGAQPQADTADRLDTANRDTSTPIDTGSPSTDDTGTAPEEPFEPDWPSDLDPFADALVAFIPGPDAGFGAEGLPDVVLGPPVGGGAGGGSEHVLTLGELGSITLEMTDLEIIDGPGPDLIVFENPFPAWRETGRVEASLDGIDWYEWPCEAENITDDFPGCAGVGTVHATPDFWVDPTDPSAAGGDAFDLEDLGLPAARFIRITDSGHNAFGYGGTTGGFDLDAIAAANWAVVASE